MRFVAALLVVIYHLGYSSWALESVRGAAYQRDAYAYPEIAGFAWFGFVGVEVFFVVSGLVIAMSAENATKRRFLTGRIERLYPAAWICATLTFFVALTTEQDIWMIAVQYLSTMLLFPPVPGSTDNTGRWGLKSASTYWFSLASGSDWIGSPRR